MTPLYNTVLVYDEDGNFVGHAIRTGQTDKLQSTNLYLEGEEAKLQEKINLLNGDVDIKKHWPDARDPEVVAILADSDFMPLETEPQELLDEENSYLVYQQIPHVDEMGNETGRLVDGDVDREASVLKFKIVNVPKRPSDVMQRVKAACEIVARRRAGA